MNTQKILNAIKDLENATREFEQKKLALEQAINEENGKNTPLRPMSQNVTTEASGTPTGREFRGKRGQIVEFVQAHPNCTPKDVAVATGIESTYVGATLSVLTKDGVVKRNGRAHYEVSLQ